MNRFAKHGLALATAGVFALSLSGCGLAQGATDSSKLDCSDLEAEIKVNEPDAQSPLSEFKPDKYQALTDWMVKNSKKFGDKKVAEAVGTYGEYGTGYYAEAQGGKALSTKQHEQFEDASRTLEKKCPGLGFGFQGEV